MGATTSRPEAKTVGVKDAARELGVSPATLYNAIKANRFPHIKVGSSIRIPKVVLDGMLGGSGDAA